MSSLDSVWETHDFVITKQTENESEYNYLLSNLSIYVQMYEKKSIGKSELVNHIRKIEKICKALLSLYNKHLLTIREIHVMIDECEVPPEREITAEVVDDLKDTTLELIKAVKQSEKILDFLKEEHQL